MIFFLTAIGHKGECREFSFMDSELETGFGFLDYISSKGHLLLRASVNDGENLLQLPVEAFDGQTGLPIIQALAQEWQALLNTPIKAKLNCQQRAAELMASRINRHERCIIKLEMALSRTQIQLAHMQTINSKESYRSRTIHQLELTLNRFQASLATERAALGKLVKRQA